MTLEYNKGILFVRLPEKINRELSYEINNELIPKILSQKIKYIVLNMYKSEYIDRYGLDALLNLKCAVHANKGKVCLCEVKDELSNEIKKIKLAKAANELVALTRMGTI